jgi:hypothetical protein
MPPPLPYLGRGGGIYFLKRRGIYFLNATSACGNMSKLNPEE